MRHYPQYPRYLYPLRRERSIVITVYPDGTFKVREDRQPKQGRGIAAWRDGKRG